MQKFPQNIKFNSPWRPYQEKVLQELESHLDDKHLNIVAAPGSGKTILGLEVMLRINQPTLILAPSIAIRNQWIARFQENFLQTESMPEWISSDVKKPQFLTVSTYQGLHAAFTNKIEKEELCGEESGEMSENLCEEETSEKKLTLSHAEKILKQLKEIGIQTLVIDEAHHLRNEWWKSLIYLKEKIEKPSIVALTATPPYDVSPGQWKNYQNLCGPIDAEISVPELVKVKNLCPHQDYVYLNTLSKEENTQLENFRTHVQTFIEQLKKNQAFISLLLNHPCIIDPDNNIETILETPEYFSSIAIFLNKTGNKIPPSFIKIISGSKWIIPDFSIKWAETLLNYFIYKEVIENEKTVQGNLALPSNEESKKDPSSILKEDKRKIVVNTLKLELKKIGAIEKRTVMLESNTQIKKLLTESLNKLNSILQIVKLEHENMGSHLRMVILTDFIRREFFPKNDDGNKTKTTEEIIQSIAQSGPVKNLSRIGVIPIFEKIRREYPGTKKIGILSGSMVVIPETANETLKSSAEKLGIPLSNLKISSLSHDNNYLTVEIKGGNNQKIVQLITDVFGRGEIEILIGTKSLLGEGWDAPSINTLILASFVGSFMLSNQMRGRAIRTDKLQPEKISNIWHLVSVEKNSLYAGHDFETLQRRFKAFVGISITENTIENGFERMGIGAPPFSESDIEKKNAQIASLAKDRKAVHGKWEAVLGSGEIKEIIPEVKIEKEALPRGFVFLNTILALIWRTLVLSAYFLMESLGALQTRGQRVNLSVIFMYLSVMLIISLVVTIPGLIRALWLFLRNGPIEGNIKQIGNALLKTLCKIDAVKTDVNKLRVISEKNKYGMVFCGLEGGTSYEKSLFLDCLEEILSPIENPRYILTRKSRLSFLLRKDYHTVPEIIGVKKEYAEFFSQMWSKYVGETLLIYTRNIEGRKLLLSARQKALSGSFQKRAERVDTWK